MALQTKTISTGSYAWQSWSNSYVISLKLTEESVDVGANTSRVSYLFTISNTDNNRFYDYYYNWDISVGGQTIPIRNFYFDLRNNNTTQTIATGSITVAHNADGTLDMPYNVSIPNVKADNQYGPPAMSLSGTWPLTAIPRASAVYCPSGIIGSPVNITIEKAEGDMTHTLTYAFGSLSGTIATKTALVAVAWTIPTDFYSQIPNAKADIGTIYCACYQGNTLLGTSTCQFYVNTDESAARPALTASVTDVNPSTVALTGDANVLVRYFSTAQASATYEAKNGATITGYTMRHNGKTYAETPITVEGVETGAFYFSVTDSRGYTTEITQNKTVIPYIKPTCNFLESPMDADGNMQINLQGNCFAGSFGAVNNEITVQYRYRTSNSSYGEWQTMPVVMGNNTYTAQVALTGLNYRLVHTFQARVVDKLTTVQSANYKVSVIPVFDWGQNDFNINGTLKIHNTPVVDYVVEQGVSGVWSYRKWASGLAECWGSFSTQSGAWNGTNNVYYITKTIPLLSGFFVSAPKVMATVNSCRYIVVPTVIVPTTTECVVTFMHFYGGIEDVAMGMLIYANGQWK
ncbi:MAG: hypothetical protein IJA74_01870 [Oscillospiraceae bacterium]|nr:hypothetical protein [Oscillospiraceae bacterium]